MAVCLKTLFPAGRVVTTYKQIMGNQSYKSSQNPLPGRAGCYKPETPSTYNQRYTVSKPSSRPGGLLPEGDIVVINKKKGLKTLFPAGRVVTNGSQSYKSYVEYVSKPSSRPGGLLRLAGMSIQLKPVCLKTLFPAGRVVTPSKWRGGKELESSQNPLPGRAGCYQCCKRI